MNKKQRYVASLNFAMRILTVNIVCSIIFLGSLYAKEARSQDVLSKTFQITVKNEPITKVISEIQKQTHVRFSYSPNLIKSNRLISYSTNNGTIKEFLEAALKNNDIGYEVIDNRIVLFKTNPKLNTSSQLAEDNLPITGRIIDEKGKPINGASVTIKGSKEGTTTNANGEFSISADEKDYLVISAVGYETQEKLVGKTKQITIVLKLTPQQMSEVIVTALGVKRTNRSVGYSIAEIKGNELSAGTEANIANELSAKVAGVQVSRAASGAGGSAKVIIRGLNSLQGNSQPLYVVDGVPLNNNNIDPAIKWGGTDYGDGISNIDPNDIETISVLKGPNAAALYGQQGGNGVVLITTKTGKSRKGLGIKISSDLSIGSALVMPDFQDLYGQGLNGNFTHFRNSTNSKIYGYAAAIAAGYPGNPKTSAGRDRLTRGSWGAKMDGQTYEDQWGTVGKFLPQPNTYQNYFNNEIQNTNSINLNGGNETMNYYISYSNLNSKGYVPTNKLDRHTMSARTVMKILPKLSLDVKVSYITQAGVNRPTLSDASDNPAYLFISMPRSITLASLQDMAWTPASIAGQLGYSSSRTIVGVEKTYATNSSTANPYWTISRTGNNDKRDRILAMANLDYEILPWLKAAVRAGTDFYTEQRLRYRSKNTYASPNRNGDMSESVIRVKDDYADALLTGTFDLSENLKLTMNAGANYQKKYQRIVGNSGSEFVVPDLIYIGNTLNKYPIFGMSESEIHSVYSFGQLSYKNFLYLDFSGRNDWSSTLPPTNNSFFYPSVSASFIATDAFKIRSSTLNFLKIRASLAQAGSSGNPYQTKGTFSLNQNTISGQPMGGYTNVIVSANLKNELTTSYEAGFDLRMLRNRLSLTATYYHASTSNQILDVPLPISTNFATMRLNAGDIQNTGVEFSISGTPIRNPNGFSWDIGFNFAANKNKVVSLYPGINTFRLGDDRNISVVAEVGKPFGMLVGTNFAWQYDANGNRLIDPVSGLPIRTSVPTNEYFGSAMPDWTGGVNNTFKYKNFGLAILLDIRQGGKIFSNTLREGLTYGTIKKTLEGRDGTYIASGMLAQKDGSGNWVSTGKANNIQVTAQDYWNDVATDKDNVVSSELINKASYISVREMSLTYQLPTKLLTRTPIKKAYLSLYGRNLFYLQRFTDGYAPEAASFNVNNSSLGLESTSLPMLRYVGAKATLEF